MQDAYLVDMGQVGPNAGAIDCWIVGAAASNTCLARSTTSSVASRVPVLQAELKASGPRAVRIWVYSCSSSRVRGAERTNPIRESYQTRRMLGRDLRQRRACSAISQRGLTIR